MDSNKETGGYAAPLAQPVSPSRSLACLLGARLFLGPALDGLTCLPYLIQLVLSLVFAPAVPSIVVQHHQSGFSNICCHPPGHLHHQQEGHRIFQRTQQAQGRVVEQGPPRHAYSNIASTFQFQNVDTHDTLPLLAACRVSSPSGFIFPLPSVIDSQLLRLVRVPHHQTVYCVPWVRRIDNHRATDRELADPNFSNIAPSPHRCIASLLLPKILGF